MARPTTDKKARKREQKSVAHAKSQPVVKPKLSRALNAQHDFVRKQEVQSKRRGNSKASDSNTMPISAGFELIELMNRRTRAFVELPLRMARCHTPFELWSEQTRLMQGFLSDCQSVTRGVMTNAVEALPVTRSTRGQ